MKSLPLLLCLFFSLHIKAQQEFIDYLSTNNIDLRKDSTILEHPIVGFTIIHGSAKAEDAEIALISSILQTNDTLYYFPEIDYASAYYFNRYLESGDSTILKKQIINYGRRVPQECGIAIYEKWKKLREYYINNKFIKVFGVDILIDYDNYINLMLELTTREYPQRESLMQYQSGTLQESEVPELLKSIVEEYQANGLMHHHSVKDSTKMNILISDLENSFLDKKTIRRDSIIFENYLHQKQLYDLSVHPQFVRMGIYHMMKMNFNNMYPGFLGMLINKNIYTASEIYSVLGILMESEVLWKKEYNKNGNYSGYETKSDGFYTGSEFFNTELLNKYAQSDITFFPLEQRQSPFAIDNFSILKNKSVWPPLADKSTLDYIDGVILIKQSDANIPIEELE